MLAGSVAVTQTKSGTGAWPKSKMLRNMIDKLREERQYERADEALGMKHSAEQFNYSLIRKLNGNSMYVTTPDPKVGFGEPYWYGKYGFRQMINFYAIPEDYGELEAKHKPDRIPIDAVEVRAQLLIPRSSMSEKNRVRFHIIADYDLPEVFRNALLEAARYPEFYSPLISTPVKTQLTLTSKEG